MAGIVQEKGSALRQKDRGIGTLFERWADEQGVRRPFDALVEMDEASRHQLAEHLDVDLGADAVFHARYDLGDDATSRPRSLNPAQAEACLVIGQDGYGIQARAHSAVRTLNPLARNYAWREILVAVVSEFDMPIADPYPNESELEAAIFEYTAEKTWEKMDADLKEEIEAFLNREKPEFKERLRKAGVGPNGIRIMAAGVFTAAKAAGFGTYITAVRAAAFLNRKIGTKLAMHQVTKTLARVLSRLNVLMWIWTGWEAVNFMFGPSRSRLLLVISTVHQHYLLKELSEEPDAA